ncbi:MAG: hypothetical protein ABR502_04235 [Chitinophagaceae bacterium]
MSIMRVIGIACAILLIAACFYPWVTIESKAIVVSGVEATGTSFGKPGYFHLLLSIIYIVLFVVNNLWSNRINIFLAAFNLAWAVRNFMLISMCHGGECPVKHTALYVVLVSSIAMLLAIFLNKTRIRNSEILQDSV